MCPPVAVFMVRGCGADILINIILSLLTLGFGGMIHAIYLVVRDDDEVSSRRLEKNTQRSKAKAEKQDAKAAEKAAKHHHPV